MFRRVVLKEGTIINCKCKVICEQEHYHTLQHGFPGMMGCPGTLCSPGTPDFDLERYKTTYHQIKPPTHSVNLRCQCSPTIDGVPQNLGTHTHVHTTGPIGMPGIEGGLLQKGQPDLSVLTRRYIIVIENCTSCIKEDDPHDHAVLEGVSGMKGSIIEE